MSFEHRTAIQDHTSHCVKLGPTVVKQAEQISAQASLIFHLYGPAPRVIPEPTTETGTSIVAEVPSKLCKAEQNDLHWHTP